MIDRLICCSCDACSNEEMITLMFLSLTQITMMDHVITMILTICWCMAVSRIIWVTLKLPPTIFTFILLWLLPDRAIVRSCLFACLVT